MHTWNQFFEMLKTTPVPENFMNWQDRKQGGSDHDPFEGIE